MTKRLKRVNPETGKLEIKYEGDDIWQVLEVKK